MAISNNEHQELAPGLSIKAPFAIDRAASQPSVSKTFILIQMSVSEIYQVKTHKDLPVRHQALMTKGIVDTASTRSFNANVASTRNSYIQLPQKFKVTKCLRALELCIESIV